MGKSKRESETEFEERIHYEGNNQLGQGDNKSQRAEKSTIVDRLGRELDRELKVEEEEDSSDENSNEKSQKEQDKHCVIEIDSDVDQPDCSAENSIDKLLKYPF